MMPHIHRILRLVCLGLLAMGAMPVAAHSTPNSEVRLRQAENMIIADIIVPRGEYAYGTGNPIDGGPQSLRIARDYLRQRINVASPDGTDWSVAFRKVEFIQAEGPPDLHAVAELRPRGNGPVDEFSINWQILTDTLPGHFALFIVEDPSIAGDGSVVGAVRAGSPPLDIAIVQPGALDLLTGAARVGVHHILEGYDHLLFLLALLLPTPLVARRGRWAKPDGTHATIGKLVRIVTAFTIGHSLTLVLAATGQWSLPSAPVEVAIAISVLVAAVHAGRPLLPGKESLVALVFGLIHGLAFATLLQETQTTMASSAMALLGFNLGIELVQLAIVAVAVPSLLVLSRYRIYSALRQTLAFVCAAAAIAWMLNRTTGLAAGAVASIEAAMSQMIWLLLTLSLIAIGLAIGRRFEIGSNPDPIRAEGS